MVKYWQLFSGFCLVVAVLTLAMDTIWAFTIPGSASSKEQTFFLSSTQRSLKVFADSAKKTENSESSNTPKRLVSDSCITEPLNKEPRSVTVITRDQIEQQMVLTRDLNQILKRLVPSYRFAHLRGSHPAVLIDGAPSFTNLRIIAPSAIERIEVIPQASDRCPY